MLSRDSSSTISTRALALILSCMVVTTARSAAARPFRPRKATAESSAANMQRSWVVVVPYQQPKVGQPTGMWSGSGLRFTLDPMVGKDGVALPDGRLERSARTRKALIDAYLDLAREKRRIPTTVEVAQRVGCSQRLIFERFGSLGQLGLAAFAHILQSRDRTVPDGEVLNADRQTRIRYQVGVRALRCETWLPVWRLVASVQDASHPLEERIEKVRALTR